MQPGCLARGIHGRACFGARTYVQKVPCSTTPPDEGDLIADLVEVDLIHEEPDQHEAAAAGAQEVLRVSRVRQLADVKARALVAQDETRLLRSDAELKVQPAV